MADEKIQGIDRKWWYVGGAGVAILGYFVYRWYKNQQAANALNAANSALANEPSGAQTASTNLSPTSATGTISTLSDWMNQAQQWLVSSLGADPAMVQNALQSYSNGLCLDSQEYNFIDKALGNLGMPPDAPYQGLIKCPNQPTTTTTSPPVVNSLRQAYDNALVAYRNAAAAHAPFAVLRSLQTNVYATQGVYLKTAGTPTARAAYDNALTAYRKAAASKASANTLQGLYSQVLYTQATYLGKAS